jgi:hypothetical protein
MPKAGSVYYSRRQVARLCYRNARELGASRFASAYLAIVAWRRRPNGLRIELDPGSVT